MVEKDERENRKKINFELGSKLDWLRTLDRK
jgi:hypothetical protein